MANRLEVEIGAKIKDFQNKVAQALKLTDKLKDKEKELKAAYKAGTISQDKYYKSLAQNASRLTRVSKASNTYKKNLHSLSGGMNVASKSIGDGSSAMLAFSRTVQDAPFGMMGISNNITNLTEQFGALKKRTGSAGGALKAMLKDLSGFGGITLAISLATSAWLMFGDKIMGATKATNEFNDSLAEVGTSAIVQFKTLTDVMLDNNATQKEQGKALSILKEKFSDFDTSLLTTKGNYKNAKIAVDNYTASLVQQAKAKAGLSIIEKKFAKIIQLEEERANARAKGGLDIFKEDKNGVKILKSEEDINKEISTILADRQDRYNNASEKEKAFRSSDSKLNFQSANEQLNNLKDVNKEEIAELNSQIEKISKLANVKQLVLFGSKGGGGDDLKEPTRKPVFIDFKLDDSSFDIIEKIDLSTDEWIGDSAFNWDEYFKLKDFDLKQQAVQAKLLEFNNSVQSIMQGSLSSTFSQLGQSLGEALATGGNAIQAVGNAIIQGIAGFLGKLGKMMIEYGTMAIIKGKLDLAIAAGGPVAIGAGIAAIAVGTALTALSGAMGSFASSGGNNDTSNAGSSSSSSGSTSFSGGATASNSGGTYVFEIAGTKLVGVLKNTLDRNKNLGGTLSIT